MVTITHEEFNLIIDQALNLVPEANDEFSHGYRLGVHQVATVGLKILYAKCNQELMELAAARDLERL